MIPIDYVVSLGHNCQTHFHIQRHNYNYEHGLPFNWSLSINHDGLIKLLDNKFSYLYNTNWAGIHFHDCGFTFCHIPFEQFKETKLLDLLYRCVNNFLDPGFQQKNILFIRRVTYISQKHKQDIIQSLKNVGFSNFYLELCADNDEKYNQYTDIDDIFYLNPNATHQGLNSWQGNYESWDKFFDYLLTKYQIKEQHNV